MSASPPTDSKTTGRVRLPVVFGAVAAVIGVVILWLAQLHNERMAWVRHTLEVENVISDLNNSINQAEAVQRGYLLTGQGAFLKVYDRARGGIPGQMAQLEALTRDNAQDLAEIPGLKLQMQLKLKELDDAIVLRRAGNLSGATLSMNDGTTRTLTSGLLRTLRRMRQVEATLLVQRTNESQLINNVLLGGVALAALVALVFAGLWVEQARRAARELRKAYGELSLVNSELMAEMASRTAAEGQVRQMQKMEAVGQLTGGIAHDFNNMLAVVMGNLNMAQRRLAKGRTDVGALIDSAMDGARRGAGVTGRLLAFARQQPLAPEPLDPNALVAGLSDLLGHTLGEEIHIETVLGPGAWRVRADAAQLESALVNLSVNARDAMPGGGRLIIETANTDLDADHADAVGAPAGPYVMIAVSDTGEGMSPEVIDKALEPFFTTKPVGKGTGLGLSQVYGFVKQSGGRLKIYSEPGRGTSIKIFLPRLVGAADPAVAEPARAPASAVSAPAGGGATVLLVEDDERVRFFAAQALADLGYRVLEADSADSALNWLKDEAAIDLILTDVVMPGANGSELAEQVRALRPELPVLYMTGFTRNAAIHNGLLAPTVKILPKPFTVDQLAAKVSELLEAVAA